MDLMDPEVYPFWAHPLAENLDPHWVWTGIRGGCFYSPLASLLPRGYRYWLPRHRIKCESIKVGILDSMRTSQQVA